MWEEVFDDGDAIDKIVEIDLFDERNSIRADELANKSSPYTCGICLSYAKIVPTRAIQACLNIAECSLSYAKIQHYDAIALG